MRRMPFKTARLSDDSADAPWAYRSHSVAASPRCYRARRATRASLSAGGASPRRVDRHAAVAAGWNWGALLILYFASSTALSRVGRAEKERRTAAIVAKGGERDAVQVLANGGVFAARRASRCVVRPDVRWVALGAGALAASAADTWATEIGTLYGGQPRSILTGVASPPGTSGGVSLAGTARVRRRRGVHRAGHVAGHLRADRRVFVAARCSSAAVAGAIADSLLGATLQSRRWCDDVSARNGAARCTTAAHRRSTRADSAGWTTTSSTS